MDLIFKATAELLKQTRLNFILYKATFGKNIYGYICYYNNLTDHGNVSLFCSYLKPITVNKSITIFLLFSKSNQVKDDEVETIFQCCSLVGSFYYDTFSVLFWYGQ